MQIMEVQTDIWIWITNICTPKYDFQNLFPIWIDQILIETTQVTSTWIYPQRIYKKSFIISAQHQPFQEVVRTMILCTEIPVSLYIYI